MRLNRYLAQATGLSRRAADQAIQAGQVAINGRPAVLGDTVAPDDHVVLSGNPVEPPARTRLIMLNKPPGYVSSRQGQGSRTVYDLLPAEYHSLKPVGRLDKDSSGLILLTDDGNLANKLTHPSFAKEKIYEVELDKSLTPDDRAKIIGGILLEDGLSKLNLKPSGEIWQVTMTEGRNRQIRRTFAAAGYTVVKLHRTRFGDYKLDDTRPGQFKLLY